MFSQIFKIKYPLFPRWHIGAKKRMFCQVSFTIDLRMCSAKDVILHLQTCQNGGTAAGNTCILTTWIMLTNFKNNTWELSVKLWNKFVLPAWWNVHCVAHLQYRLISFVCIAPLKPNRKSAQQTDKNNSITGLGAIKRTWGKFKCGIGFKTSWTGIPNLHWHTSSHLFNQIHYVMHSEVLLVKYVESVRGRFISPTSLLSHVGVLFLVFSLNVAVNTSAVIYVNS